MGSRMGSLVLLRHGQSEWNQDNRFTGWIDVDLTLRGRKEARQAGRFLHDAGISFDVACTSLLRRAIRTLWIALDELDQMWLPVQKDWRLNERHYGALQGLDKAAIADQYGKDQVFQWRRSYAIPPPPLAFDDPFHPRFDPRYADIDPVVLPSTESLENTLQRVLPCWQQSILPQLRQGRRILVVAHGNSLRALVKYLDDIPDQNVPELNIPTGIPIVYDLDENQNPLQRYYLGDPDVVRAATEAAAKAAVVKGIRE
ncbi:MAG TPA: 2,3-diphosphoglycerate-dependent phosphoglycerate mutase [Anaerolineaceae bacterium]